MKCCMDIVTAMKSVSGEYLHRGHLHTESVGRVTAGGTEFHYTRRRESGVETLTARGPVVEPLVVEVRICRPICRVLTRRDLQKCTLHFA